ncbi:MAG: 16S rRNA (adenine(1518)-N(6)/adenine(1519)-N(6))-dimethyltransferase RsmA [Thermoplasmatota archaeon]
MSGPTKNKALGQHFLREPRIARRILEAANLEPHHRVLEIGPGGGVLTEALCEEVAEVVAVEADDRFADLLEGRFPNLTLVRGDALQVDLEALGPFDRIVSNLPYQISGPVTARFLDLHAAQGWGHAVLMYQKEFANRLLAGPGSKQYGRLSVYTARYCQVAKVRDVPPGCFEPPPKVHSTVITLTPHEEPPFEVRNEAAWRRIVDGAFSQRRKQLKNTVHGVELGELATLRPEQVTPAQFAELANGA